MSRAKHLEALDARALGPGLIAARCDRLAHLLGVMDVDYDDLDGDERRFVVWLTHDIDAVAGTARLIEIALHAERRSRR